MSKFQKKTWSANRDRDSRLHFRDSMAVDSILQVARLEVLLLVSRWPPSTLRDANSSVNQSLTISICNSSSLAWPLNWKHQDWWCVTEPEWLLKVNPTTLCTVPWPKLMLLTSAGMLWMTVCRCMVDMATYRITLSRGSSEIWECTRSWKEPTKSWLTSSRGLCWRMTEWRARFILNQ